MFEISEITQDFLNRLFNSNALPRIQLIRDESYPREFTDAELAQIREIAQANATVVGIDVYRYSQFPTQKQMFIPHLLDLIYEETWLLIKQNYEFVFQDYGKPVGPPFQHQLEERAHFISTGDGGYQLLQTPLHGLLFVLTHATVLRLYNADRFMRKLHAKIGPIEVRYAITFDEIYHYRGAFYGAGVINNSRILSRDTLNRLLIDENAHQWFIESTLGIENLMSIGLSDLVKIEPFSGYDHSKLETGHNVLIPFTRKSDDREGFTSIDLERIGTVHQKMTRLSIYNVHVQALIHYENLFGLEQTFTVSVGNLNTSGIENQEA